MFMDDLRDGLRKSASPNTPVVSFARSMMDPGNASPIRSVQEVKVGGGARTADGRPLNGGSVVGPPEKRLHQYEIIEQYRSQRVVGPPEKRLHQY